MAPDVVARRDDVGSGGEELLGELRRKPDAVGGVLAVDDAKTDAQLVAELRQAGFDRAPAGGTEDVADDEKLQGSGF